MPETSRLLIALRSIAPADWDAFERFCGAFFADEFSDLRSIGGSKDKGRDGVLMSTGENGVVLQYSVAVDWRAKINDTINRLVEARIECRTLIYGTSQDIGPRADDLKSSLRARGVTLDIRDQRYFLDRVERSPATRLASQELTARIVDPLLAGADIVRNADLTQPEMKAGLLFLELQLYDADNRRGLTKLSIDALIMSALSRDPSVRKTRAEIVMFIRKQFPSHGPRLGEVVNGCLERLKRQRRVTWTRASDSYALQHSELQSITSKAEQLVVQRQAAEAAIAHRLAEAAESLGLEPKLAESRNLIDAVQALFEATLRKHGTAFIAVLVGEEASTPGLDLYEIARPIVYERDAGLKALGVFSDDLVELITETVSQILRMPGSELQRYLRNLGDAYTMLAFLRDTPDVRRAVEGMFSRGRLVLDATVLLPIFVETLLPESERRFTNLLSAATQAGMKLSVTDGVLNEVHAHLSLSLTCHRTDPTLWSAKVPLVLADWLAVNTSRGDFGAFVEGFRGPESPILDLEEFFAATVGSERIDLQPAVDKISLESRGTFTELWRLRKPIRPGQDEAHRDLLLGHDVEMYLGVLGLRGVEERPLYGHQTWWVTSDRTAFGMYRLARDNGVQLASPAPMHPDFLSSVLAIGPSRQHLDTSVRDLLPVALNIQEMGWGDPQMQKLAYEQRKDLAGKPPYYVRRKLREAANRAKARHEWPTADADDA